MDSLTPEKRSWNMRQIHGKDTSIEKVVRSYLFSHGFRYRKNDRRYPGRPDIVLPKYKTVIFVNGCFWHRHKDCKLATMPKANVEYWQKKFDKNTKNDILHEQQLKEMGWHVITIWECELKKDYDGIMQKTISQIKRFGKTE